MAEALSFGLLLALGKEMWRAWRAKKAAEKSQKLMERAREYEGLCADLNAQLQAVRDLRRGGKK